MDTGADGIWLIPSHGRASTNLPRFLAACLETNVSTPGAILVTREDYETNRDAYEDLKLPAKWLILICDDCETTAEKTAWGLAHFPDAAWYGWLADDLIPETPRWDRRVVEALNGLNFVSTVFGEKSSRMNGAVAWSGDVIRAIGYIYPPGLQHLFLDDVWEEIGRMTGRWQVLSDVLVTHYHGPKVGDPDATSDRVNSFWEHDRKAYIAWQKTDGIPAVERIMEMMQAKGVKVVRNDFRGVKLCILVPNGSGSYRHEFASSLQNTISFIKQFGGEASVIALPGCSDIYLARNRLMARFMDTDATHCLWADDDMVWEVGVVGELIRADKDFCGIAGRMKRDEPMFCARSQDDHGNSIPIRMDPATGFLEVTAVGFAFVLMKRDACVRLWQHYKDAEYVTASGEVEVGLFESMILNRRRMSEDFACCWRWRAIGGKIYVGAHLPIGHIGTQTYSGNWAQALQAEIAAESRAA